MATSGHVSTWNRAFVLGSYIATCDRTATASNDPSGDHETPEGISSRKRSVERATQNSIGIQHVSIALEAVQCNGAPSTPSDFVFTERILHVLMFPSSPVVASRRSSCVRAHGLKATPVTFFSPCGRSMRVFNIQKPALRSHCQIFMYTSARNASSASLESMVAIQSPESESTTCSTREGCSGLSSRLDTRFEGETSSSDKSVDVDGEKVWREEGWEEGRMRVEEREWTARGTAVDVEGRSWDIAGSTRTISNSPRVESSCG